MSPVTTIRRTIENRLKAVQRDNELNVSDSILQKIAEDLTSAIENDLRCYGLEVFKNYEDEYEVEYENE